MRKLKVVDEQEEPSITDAYDKLNFAEAQVLFLNKVLFDDCGNQVELTADQMGGLHCVLMNILRDISDASRIVEECWGPAKQKSS